MAFHSGSNTFFDTMLHSYKCLILCADKLDQDKDKRDDWIAIDCLILGLGELLDKYSNRFNIAKFLIDNNVEINPTFDAKAYGLLAFKYYDKFMREYFPKPEDNMRIFGKILFMRITGRFETRIEKPYWFEP